jgi:hypothetical protein
MRVLASLGIGTASLVCVVAAGLVITLSVFMNGYFAYQLSGGRVEDLLSGSLAIAPLIAAGFLACVDILKAFTPLLGARSWANRKYAHVAVCAVLMAGGMTLSLFAAYGFMMEQRAVLKSERTTKQETKADLDIQLKRSRDRIAAYGFARPAAAIEADLDAERQNRRWQSSAQCTDATASKSRAFCTAYNNLRAELATAKAAEIERKQLALIEAKLDAIRSAGGVQAASPQLDGLARLTGYKASNIEAITVGIMALILEFVSTFGLYFALGHGPKYGSKSVPQPAPQAAQSAPPQTATQALPVEIDPPPTISTSAKAVTKAAPQEPIDLVAKFGVDRLEKRFSSAVALSDLHADYKEWCQGQAVKPLALAAFTACLEEIVEHADGVEIEKFGRRSVLTNMQLRRRLAAA